MSRHHGLPNTRDPSTPLRFAQDDSLCIGPSLNHSGLEASFWDFKLCDGFGSVWASCREYRYLLEVSATAGGVWTIGEPLLLAVDFRGSRSTKELPWSDATDNYGGVIMVVDLRSDFLSRPTPEMVEAMSKAALQKCSFGLREDPILLKLEGIAASMLGKEDALFFPTGTMCNQTAINIACSHGEKLIAETNSHVITSEASAPAVLSGVMPKLIDGERGFIEPNDLEDAIEEGDELRSRTSLIVLENTHNRSGGTVLTSNQTQRIYDVAHRHNIPIHLDGSRLFNAAVYLGISASDLCHCADSVSISLNKGLSAPMGAILAGSKAFIKEAVRIRQRFGGGWRPTNILAAAGIVALETMVERLAEDHRNAKQLAEGIAECKGVSIDPENVQTNLVIAKVNHPKLSIQEIIHKLKDRDILIIQFGPGSIRMVTYREINEDHVNEVIRNLLEITKT